MKKLNFYQRKNYLKTNKTKFNVVAIEFWRQNPEIAVNLDEAIESFESAFLENYVSVDFINVVYNSILKNEKIILKAGNSLDSVTNLSENDMVEIGMPKDFKISPEKLREALKEVDQS